jgi:hypothetical protein
MGVEEQVHKASLTIIVLAITVVEIVSAKPQSLESCK